MWKRKLSKIVHTLSAFAYAGGIAAYLFVLAAAPEPTDISQVLTLRTSIDFLVSWLIIPGMLVVLVSGLVSMMVHTPFMEQGWVLLKAVSGVLIFEASLASIDGPARRAKEAAERAAAGEFDLAELSGMMHDEWTALVILLGLAVANVVLGIWRPRPTRRKRYVQPGESWFKPVEDEQETTKV
ncbi:MAG: DUF2269 family protein [Pseudomonadota bacterium]